MSTAESIKQRLERVEARLERAERGIALLTLVQPGFPARLHYELYPQGRPQPDDSDIDCLVQILREVFPESEAP